MVKHVLCTGGAGYIGSHTVIKLIEGGFDVSIMDNFVNSNPEVLVRVKEITGKDVPLYSVDMCDAECVDNVFASAKFDGVIHFAGLKAVGESVAKPLWYYQNNIKGTFCILEAMRKYDCKALVFSSSATVYKPCETPLDESKPIGCSNPYGWTKFMIEQILQDEAKADPGLCVSLLRYFNPCGSHPSGRIGESPSGIPNNLMPFLQQVAIGRREFLSIFGSDYPTPDGTGVRDYIHVDDLAEGHICAMNKLFEIQSEISASASAPSRVLIHNLGSGKGMSVLEMVKGLEEASGKKLAYKMLDRRPGDLGVVVANPAKAEADFGWRTKRGIKEIMESAWKWQSENPYGFDAPPAKKQKTEE